MSQTSIYEDIALRTDGDIYLGVVGPVRTGKSTFIKRFMETVVLPNMDDVYKRERARDELPQSGSGRTIMTAEPKFVPEEAVSVQLDGNAMVSVRLVDCVGYMISGASGQYENGEERLVTTPWFDREVTLTEAAEKGTAKVISEHSTIGIVITCDGTICDIPRENYQSAEERVIRELKEIGKPFVVLVNSAEPMGTAAQKAASELKEKFNVACLPVNCAELTEQGIGEILKTALYDFPVTEVAVFLPTWVEALAEDHPLRKNVYRSILTAAADMDTLRSVHTSAEALSDNEIFSEVAVGHISPGTGRAEVRISVPQELYYQTISEQSGMEIRDDGDLMRLLTEISAIKKEYDRVHEALTDVREKGYGIVIPSQEELRLEEPEIVRQGGRYGVRLKASAPSIHMILANVETEVNPALGGEKASEEIINFLLQGFEGDTGRIWESNIFGKSLYDIAGEGVLTKLKHMPPNSQAKIQHSITRIVNDGSGALICIII